MKEEFIAGRNPVAEALRSGRALNKVMVQDGARGVTEIIAAARGKGVAVEFVKSDKLDKLAQGVRHQGVVAYAAPVEFKTLEDALKKAAAKGEAPFLLLLDELQDPQNLGALIRTADAAGVHGILLPKRRSCPLNAVVAKISAGAVEYVPVIQIGNIVQQLKDLKKQGHDEHTIDLVVPLGYTFNLEGAAVYFSVATIFIAHAYGIQFSLSSLLFTVLLLTLIGKTAATVPSGAIVVLLAAAPQLGLPVEGVALIFAVDFFVNAGRTMINVLGQILTVSVIEKTEGYILEEEKESQLSVSFS